MSGEAYAETALLVAVMEGDEQRAEELIADMHPSERVIAAGQAERMASLLRSRCEMCGQHVSPLESALVRRLGPDLLVHRACARQAGSRASSGGGAS